MKKTLVAVPLVLTASLLTAPAAQADDRRCSGIIRAVSIDGNVIVPAGATCRLLGTRVDGNIHVKSNATLIARGVKVGGSVQAENHHRVVIRARWADGTVKPSRIDGSIQLKQGGGGLLARNIVGSDIQLFSNDGLFTVRGNRVNGNLQCKSNDPKPRGGNNVVQGNKEDQCESL